jgi:hypothetical protein
LRVVAIDSAVRLGRAGHRGHAGSGRRRARNPAVGRSAAAIVAGQPPLRVDAVHAASAREPARERIIAIGHCGVA